jgi:hypothetical protein
MPESPSNALTVPQDIPDALQVPAGEVLLLRAYGKGVQIYTCIVNTQSPPSTPGIFKQPPAPHAILLEGDRDEGDLVAIHFAGPTGPNWQALDGSKVVGKKVAQVSSSDPDSVDWLLLEAIANEGNGLFSQVKHIQRLYTDGGQSPPGGCDPHNQVQTLVEYSAQYLFYGPAPAQQ